MALGAAVTVSVPASTSNPPKVKLDTVKLLPFKVKVAELLTVKLDTVTARSAPGI